MAMPHESQAIDEGNLPRPYDDVRQWLDIVESMGELKRINGADWNLEIGTMAELIYRERRGHVPPLLFDRIKGYPEGFRLLFGQHLLSAARPYAGLPLDSAGSAWSTTSRRKSKI